MKTCKKFHHGKLETSSKKDESSIEVEVLNANAKSSRLNELIKLLNSNGCNVVKIGNYTTTENEASRIVTYGENTNEELNKIKEISGIKKVETSNKESEVKFSIIIGSSY